MDRVNEFLNKVYKRLYNKNHAINVDNIYSMLIQVNGENIRENFPYWKNHYKYNSNISCFTNLRWYNGYFCQFENRNKFKDTFNQIKVYVPLDKKHIKLGVERIFDFLASNNIAHTSKVSGEERTDDVVIRLFSSEDLKKLTDFIDNDDYIGEGLLDVNPFVFNYHGIGLACDGHISYNIAVSNLIELYLSESNRISADGFRKWLIDKYVSITNDDKEMRKMLLRYLISEYRETSEYNNILRMTDFVNVMKLLIMSLDEESTLDDFCDNFDVLCDRNIYVQNFYKVGKALYPEKINYLMEKLDFQRPDETMEFSREIQLKKAQLKENVFIYITDNIINIICDYSNTKNSEIENIISQMYPGFTLADALIWDINRFVSSNKLNDTLVEVTEDSVIIVGDKLRLVSLINKNLYKENIRKVR